MKKIQTFGFGLTFSILMLIPFESNARCYDRNYVLDGHLYLVRDCYFLGIRTSHTVTDMGLFYLEP